MTTGLKSQKTNQLSFWQKLKEKIFFWRKDKKVEYSSMDYFSKLNGNSIDNKTKLKYWTKPTDL
jgi:hypothetical protein